ncbi:MAG: solute:sodium symporter family transporter [Lentisphaeria bacterium]
MPIFTLLSFFFCTAFVAFLTWRITKGEDVQSRNGYYLAGRSLTFPVIAGSLLLTNLSTEQLVGLNGDGFLFGLSVMVWEVAAVVALVIMGLFFLPRFLKSGITTIPELLELRFDQGTQVICNLIFLLAYATILLPIVLYTGASGLAGILDLPALTGIQNQTVILWLSVWFVGCIGSMYALFGGLRSVAVSDTLNSIGLLSGGFLITLFGLSAIGDGDGIWAGLQLLGENIPERLNSIGGPKDPVPFSNIFTGVIIINVFYWCTNQQIIQRTFAAKNLAEGQKGIFLTGLLKLLGPMYLVLPGIMAYYLFVYRGNETNLAAVDAYGKLVRTVLPAPLAGFFAAVMVGAILSSFNSVLNSTCTLFSLGIYKNLWKKEASEIEMVKSGKYFGLIIAIISMCVAPLLASQKSIFGYLQTMNGLYSIPICAVVFIALLTKKVPPLAAKVALLGGVLSIGGSYLFFPELVKQLGGYYHFLGIMFVFWIVVMLFIRLVKPMPQAWVQKNSNAVDLTPWKYAWPAGITLLILVMLVYGLFADFSVLAG